MQTSWQVVGVHGVYNASVEVLLTTKRVYSSGTIALACGFEAVPEHQGTSSDLGR